MFWLIIAYCVVLIVNRMCVDCACVRVDVGWLCIVCVVEFVLIVVNCVLIVDVVDLCCVDLCIVFVDCVLICADVVLMCVLVWY